MKVVKIPLADSGHIALIDWSDREKALRYKWHVKRSSKSKRVYAQTTIRLTPGRNGKKTALTLHRYIMDAKTGDIVDHINGDSLDNRRSNLRLVTHRENSMNVVSSKRQKKGGYKGVTWHNKGQKWEAGICAGELRANGKRKRIYLGLFDDPVDAALEYDKAAREHFGEFAALNFPEMNVVRMIEPNADKKGVQSR